MQTIREGVLRGTFKGFQGPGTTFEFLDGQRWRQVCETVKPHRKFMPEARVMRQNDRYFIQIENIKPPVEVVPER